MRSIIKLGSITLGAVLAFGAVACGGDDESPGSGGTGGSGGSTGGTSGSGGSTGGTGGSTGGSGGSTGGTGGSTAGTGGTGGSVGGSAGSAGAPASAPYEAADCYGDTGPEAAVLDSETGAFVDDADWLEGWTNFSIDESGFDPATDAAAFPETGDRELDADTVYLLDTKVWVADGETLTIPAGTVIQADTEGSLIVSRGGTIMAEGTADNPIIFTSVQDEGSKAKGDWGGVIILGKGQNFKGTDVLIEGLDDLPENQHGGAEDDDNSGVFAYVRIEFGGTELSPDNEINGLTLGSVGSGTEIHHVMVNTTLDDCFEWFGGAVNAHHLVCNNAGDDMFDADQGYRGELSELLGVHVEPLSGDPSGFEMDSDLGGATPVTNVTASNVTLCGANTELDNLSFGMVLREGLTGAFSNLIVSGFDASVDARDDFGSEDDANVTIADSFFFGNRVEPIAYDETETCDDMPICDDDMGFDERAWFSAGSGNMSE